MSVETEVTSMIQNIKNDYEGISNLGVDLTNIDKNIENIRTCLDTIYSSLPKVTGEGTEVTLTPTLKGKLNIQEKGNSTQEGEPSPTNPISIKSVTGNNNVVVKNSDNSASQTLPLNLGSIELAGIPDTNYKDKIFKAVNGNPVYDSLDNTTKASLTSGTWYKQGNLNNTLLTITNGNTEANGFRSTEEVTTPIGLYPELFCTHFIRASEYKQAVNNQGANTPNRLGLNDFGRVLCNIAGYTTKQEYIDFFSNNNVYVCYPLKNSTYTAITDTTLISQLEAIDKAQSYNGTTIITSTYDSSNAQMILGASALKGE